MTDTLYGLTASDVAADATGNILPGRQAVIYTAPYAGQIFAGTKDVGPDYTPGAGTGGIITTDSNGRVMFFATNTTATLWLDWGDGTRWPVNPTRLDDIIERRVQEANESQIELLDRLQAAVEELEGSKASSLPPFYDMPHPYPYVSARRGGSYIVPEGTRLGRLNAYGLGMQVIDGGDIHATSDGVLYDCHDTTLDRTTNLTGEIAKTTSMRVMQGKVDCSSWFGGGWADQPITSIVDTLDDLGGKVYVTLEVKTDVDPKYAQKVVDLIAARGLTKQILIASFDEALLGPAIAGGHEVMLLGTSGTAIATDTGLLSRGVRYFGGSQALTAATAKQIADNGVRVVTYSTERHANVNKFRNGASGHLWGYISDDPLYLKGHVEGTYAYRLTSDPFGTLTYYHGHQADNLSVNPEDRGTFQADAGGAFFCAPVKSQRRAWLQGWASPLVSPSSYSITYEQDWLNAATSAGGALVIGCPDDSSYTGDDQAGGGLGGPPGYEVWLFTSGLLRLFRRDSGAVPVVLSDNNDTAHPVTPGTPEKLTVTVSGSKISVTRASTGVTVSATDNTYRGGYVHLLANDNGAAAGVRWRNISVSGA